MPRVRSNNLLKKALPGRTTAVAKLSKPKSDCRSLKVTFDLPIILSNAPRILLNFSCGKRASISILSISMPRKIMHVQGDTVFSSFRETPISLYTN